MAKKPFLDLLNGYEEPKGADGKTLPLGKRFFVREISGVMTAEMKRRASTRFYKFLNALSRIITYTKARVYGAAALSFGALSFVFVLVGYYLGFVSYIPTTTLIMCAVFCAFGGLLLLFDKPIPIVLQDNPIFDFIFFDFFCIQRIHRKTGEASIHTAVAVIFGVLCALLSFVISPIYMILGFAALLFLSVTMGSPEFSYITGILLLPYINAFPYARHLFVATILLTAFSFVRKVIYGKRVIFFEQYDFIILVMMALIFVSGVFIKGYDSFFSSAMLCVMSLGYFLTSSIITNRRLADRVMNTVVVSAIPLSFISIVSYIAKCYYKGAFTLPSEKAFFDTTSVAATFLIVAVCFSFAHMVQTHTLHKKLFYITTLILTGAALVTTGEVFAIFAMVLALAAYIVFKLKRPVVTILAPILFALPFAIYLLPDDILIAFFDFVPDSGGYSEYIKTLYYSFVEFSENFLIGISIGAGSFASEMAPYGITATNSANLFLELALEAGVFSLAFFLFLLVSRIRHRIKYYSLFVRDSVVKHSQPVVSSGVCALIFYGMFSYIWAEASMFYLFFLVFAVESAMLRVSRRARDERILYYEDAKSSESSAVDISLLESVD